MLSRHIRVSLPTLRSQLLSRHASILQRFMDNIKKEMDKDEELKSKIKEFRQKTESLHSSESVEKMREKFKNIEQQTTDNSTAFRTRLSEVKKGLEGSDVLKKTKEMSGNISKKAEAFTREAGDVWTKTKDKIPENRMLKENLRVLQKEVDAIISAQDKIYVKPQVLIKRSQLSSAATAEPDEGKPIAPNENVTHMELHKDVKWKQSWEQFKDNNQYINRVFEMKQKLDESDHVVVRVSRMFSEKVQGLFGGVMEPTALSKVFTEINKIDPSFDRIKFINYCERIMIPNILEAIAVGDMDVIEDWCSEALFNILRDNVKRLKAANAKMKVTILDVDSTDIISAMITDQGPVFVIAFIVQEVSYIEDARGKVIEGSPDSVNRIQYVWAVCRDKEDMDPLSAWRLLEMSAHKSTQPAFKLYLSSGMTAKRTTDGLSTNTRAMKFMRRHEAAVDEDDDAAAETPLFQRDWRMRKLDDRITRILARRRFIDDCRCAVRQNVPQSTLVLHSDDVTEAPLYRASYQGFNPAVETLMANGMVCRAGLRTHDAADSMDDDDSSDDSALDADANGRHGNVGKSVSDRKMAETFAAAKRATTAVKFEKRADKRQRRRAVERFLKPDGAESDSDSNGSDDDRIKREPATSSNDE